jgi:hypothetical protein
MGGGGRRRRGGAPTAAIERNFVRSGPSHDFSAVPLPAQRTIGGCCDVAGLGRVGRLSPIPLSQFHQAKRCCLEIFIDMAGRITPVRRQIGFTGHTDDASNRRLGQPIPPPMRRGVSGAKC